MRAGASDHGVDELRGRTESGADLLKRNANLEWPGAMRVRD